MLGALYNLHMSRLVPVLISYPRYSVGCKRLVVSVPHSESGVVPMSSLSGVGLSGLWEFGMGGIIG